MQEGRGPQKEEEEEEEEKEKGEDEEEEEEEKKRVVFCRCAKYKPANHLANVTSNGAGKVAVSQGTLQGKMRGRVRGIALCDGVDASCDGVDASSILLDGSSWSEACWSSKASTSHGARWLTSC